MIAPLTIEALRDVAAALSFELTAHALAKPIGIDHQVAAASPQYALRQIGGGGHLSEVSFDGTARECTAFLIGHRDLRARMLAELHAIVPTAPYVSGWTPCPAVDAAGQRCVYRAGHPNHLRHATIMHWEGKQP